MKGKVKWFDGKKGYGFITGEDGKEVFVHYSGIVKDGFKALNEKQEVEYELGEGSKGIQAINVKVVEYQSKIFTQWRTVPAVFFQTPCRRRRKTPLAARKRNSLPSGIRRTASARIPGKPAGEGQR